MSKNVLITGGCGFIGSNLVNHIVDNLNWNICVVDNLVKGKFAFLSENTRKKNVQIIIDDFSSPSVLNKIKNQNFDFVFHLAAHPSVEFSVSNPLQSNDENVSKTLMLMEASKGNIEKFIFSSSSALYGDVSHLPTKESSSKYPKSPYGLQKYIIEQYLEVFRELYKFPYISLRYFNVFGQNQLGSSPYSTVVSAWLHKIKHGLPLRVDGDGNQTRDMCHVQDVVQANILAALSPMSGDTFNVGSGRSVSNNYILELLRERFNNLKIQFAPARDGDVRHTLADLTKISGLLKYEPKVSFENGLEMTTNWSQISDIF